MAWIASLKEMGKVGVRTSVDKLLRYGMVKPGRQVGSDEFGNKYVASSSGSSSRARGAPARSRWRAARTQVL